MQGEAWEKADAGLKMGASKRKCGVAPSSDLNHFNCNIRLIPAHKPSIPSQSIVLQPSHSFYDTIYAIMTRGALSKLVRGSRTSIRPLASQSSSAAIRASMLRPAILPIAMHVSRASSIQGPRFFSSTRPSLKGLSPESENPQPTPREPEHNVTESVSGPADITIEQFHEVADAYLEALIEKLEELQEETEEVDVEYSVCPLFFPMLLWRN